MRTVEQNKYNLLNLHKSYRQYHKAVNELVSEEYWASISGEIVFGYDAAIYTRDDLANMLQEEYDILKERMLHILRGAEMDKLSATVRIEQDKFTYGSGQTAELREDGIKGLNYQAHGGKDIGYPTVIVLPGTSDSS
ncbi:hypothetical protein MKX42_30470 [Paenibacillus sp. FSL R7-0204]|uniref:hypothetical protein n=1 Tax=Paenibacillus sp. FSL R7-0204 TaxID=2921675 RepID=UPI0030FC9063